MVTDRFLLPNVSINDEIEYYEKIYKRARSKYSSSTYHFGYRYYTKKQFIFTIEMMHVRIPQVQIDHTRIFNFVTAVRTEEKNYTDRLVSGMPFINGLFFLIFTLSSVISLILLKGNKTLSENAFLNIILLNAFLLFALLIGYISS